MQKSHGISNKAGIRKDGNAFVADRHHPSSEFFLPMKKPELMYWSPNQDSYCHIYRFSENSLLPLSTAVSCLEIERGVVVVYNCVRP
jgi:hypothetical protein